MNENYPTKKQVERLMGALTRRNEHGAEILRVKDLCRKPST